MSSKTLLAVLFVASLTVGGFARAQAMNVAVPIADLTMVDEARAEGMEASAQVAPWHHHHHHHGHHHHHHGHHHHHHHHGHHHHHWPNGNAGVVDSGVTLPSPEVMLPSGT